MAWFPFSCFTSADYKPKGSPGVGHGKGRGITKPKLKKRRK